MRISVAIPCYEMYGVGVQMLERSLDALDRQTFRDFEILVTDDSEDNKLANLCDDFNVRYLRNPNKKGMGSNTNFAISQANGELIKILYQDDYLAHDKALEVISENFKPEDDWLITACSNNLKPYFSNKNTLGSPSVLTIRNSDPLLFNEKLKWALDLEYYKRLYKVFGKPKILNDVNVIMGIGPWQETYHLTLEEKLTEENL